MITLVGINKGYKDQEVIRNFSYAFKDTGFYLFFGPSGCGKTTLANIIFGVIEPDSGKVIYSEDLGESESKESIQSNIGYVTQDSYFIDYLTISEHFELNQFTTKVANELLVKFKLEHVVNRYPSQLSGGEKQRISIIMALCQGKKVLILDEPTSALNFENKRLVFEMLRELREQILIICISHDLEAQLFCDYIIDFRKLSKCSMQNIAVNGAKGNIQKTVSKNNSVNLYSYIKRQKSYKNNWRLSKVIFVIIMMLSFLMIYVCVNPEGKIINSLEKTYHLNYISVDIPIKDEKQLRAVNEFEGVIAVAYDYSFSEVYNTNDIDGVSTNHNSFPYRSLPIGESFYYRNHLAAGRYFEKSNEIILGSDYQNLAKFDSSIMAQVGKKSSELIGKTIQLDTNNGKGKEEFTIVGVFNPFGKKESEYFTNMMISELNANIYVNNQYTNTYYFDDRISTSEEQSSKSKFFVYFDDYVSMERFISEYGTEDNRVDKTKIYAYPIAGSLFNVLETISGVSMVLLPLSILSALVSLLFYIQSTAIFLKTNRHIFGIYQYYGFKWKDVRSGYLMYYVHDIFTSFLYAWILSLIMMLLTNWMNAILGFWPYQLMDFDLLVMAAFITVLFILFVIFISLVLNKLKKVTWYDLMHQERDLL